MSKINCRKILSFFLSVLFLIPSFFLNYYIPVQAWTETDEPIHTLTIGGYTGDGQVNQPFGVTTDSSGNVYVTDRNNHRVQKFDSSGNFLMKFGTYGTGDGQFNGPVSVSVDSGENIYVVDYSNHRVQKFDSSGNFLLKFGSNGTGNGQFSYPFGIDVDSSGNIYVADYQNNRIQKFDSGGNFILKFGSSGTGNGQFSYPAGVAVDSNGNIFVLDCVNQRIQKFDSSGNFLLKFGSSGTGDGQFQYPYGIEVDSSGSIYVADYQNHRIQKFDSSGNFLLKFGSNGTGDGQINYPYCVAVDNSGNIYVTEGLNHRIQKFDSNGNFLLKFGSSSTDDGQFNGPNGVTVDSSGNIYVVEMSNNRIQKFDSSGNFLMKFGSYGTGDGQFQNPAGITVDSSGNIYVAGFWDYRIQKFNSNGNFVLKFGSNGTGNGQFRLPSNLVVDSNGNIYVADYQNNRIQKFDSNGSFLLKFGSTGAGNGQFNYPWAVTLDNSTNIYVADSANNRIQKFDSSGNFLMKFGSSGTGNGQFQYPRGVTIDNSGNIYVSDSNNHRIQKFDSNGNFLLKFGTTGIGESQFQSPASLDIDNNGNIYVADAGNHRIQRFTYDQTIPTGTISVNSGLNATQIQSVELNLSATDDLSGVYQMIVSESNDFTGASWEDYATTKVFTLSSGDGEKTVYVKYVDNRTNYSEVASDSIFFDTTPPTGTISINSDEEITNTDEVTLTLSAIDNLTEVSKMMVSNKGDYSGGTWETYNTSKEWRLSLGDGEKRVYVKYKDEVGNISSSNSDSIEMDMGSPTGTLIINEGEEYTSSREVVLHITGEDEVTGVEEMRISEDRTMEGVDWEGYETSREYTLSEGDGYKVIYIQYRDGIGNESEVYGSNITLDSNTEIEVTEIGEEEVEGEIENWETEETTPTFTGEGEVGATITIEIEGIETGTVIVNEDGVWSWTPSIELTRGQEYNIIITSRDLAGNEDIQSFTLGIADEEVIEVNQTTPEAQTTTTQLPNTGVIFIIGLMILGGLLWTGMNFKVIEKLKMDKERFWKR